jgi:hypothetical protein
VGVRVGVAGAIVRVSVCDAVTVGDDVAVGGTDVVVLVEVPEGVADGTTVVGKAV